ncbi:MAG: hypothetical protein ACTSQP_02780 [Promethearchaeota archaeon]
MEASNFFDPYNQFKDSLNNLPFIIIIGKYDHILGPRAITSTVEIEVEEEFIRNLLRDALNTKNKFVILDFKNFYAQVCKTEVNDPNARGGKQLYAIILLRHIDNPIIPSLHFKRIEMIFHKLGSYNILKDKPELFSKFFEEIYKIYINKDEILPLESFNMQIRSGVNTIKGFCELILEDKEKREISLEELYNYIEMMYDSCNDIIDALNKQFSTE